MKRNYQTLAAITLLSMPFAGPAGEIDLSIGGFANDAGLARIVLMKGEAGYHGELDAERVVSVPIRNRYAQWRAKDVPSGEYSIIAHHDTNSNNLLDRPVFGLPTEPYGFSKGAWTSIGIPAWPDVSFTVDDGLIQQAVHLRMNAFAVFGQLALIGGLSLFLISSLFFLLRRIQRPRPLDSGHSN